MDRKIEIGEWTQENRYRKFINSTMEKGKWTQEDGNL